MRRSGEIEPKWYCGSACSRKKECDKGALKKANLMLRTIEWREQSNRQRMGRVERWGDLYMSYEGRKHMGNRGEDDDENRRVFLNHKKEEKWRGRGVAGQLVQKQGCEGCQQLT